MREVTSAVALLGKRKKLHTFVNLEFKECKGSKDFKGVEDSKDSKD